MLADAIPVARRVLRAADMARLHRVTFTPQVESA